MTRFGEARRQGEHTGKTGYVSTKYPPKPIPYSFVEETASNLYPYARDFIPSDIRKYTDSYYDLRNEKYQFWYDKWGKPHINKWWLKQLDETLRIQKAWRQAQQTTDKAGNTYSNFYGKQSRNRFSSKRHYCRSGFVRGRFVNCIQQRRKQRSNSSYRKAYSRKYQSKYQYRKRSGGWYT